MDTKTKTFIDKSKIKHGDCLYNYDKVAYINSYTKVIITCKLHKDFEQTPNNHLKGSGCPVCGASYKGNQFSKDTTADRAIKFIKKANEVHENLYNYDKINYIDSLTEVTIVCNIHGDFKQVPRNHISGSGCHKCAHLTVAKKQRHSTEDFVNKAKLVHKNLYEYSQVNYKGIKTKVKINCKVHGFFNQTPPIHLKGAGCPQCYFNPRTSNSEDFIIKARKKHKNFYSYSKTDYVTSYKKVIINCPTHGDFSQKPNSHLRGAGCPECGKLMGGFKKSDFRNLCIKNNNGLGILYVLKCFNSSETFYKIGITSASVKARYSCKNSLPYEYEIVKEIVKESDIIYDLENKIFKSLYHFKYKPLISFGGQTECFSSIDSISI